MYPKEARDVHDDSDSEDEYVWLSVSRRPVQHREGAGVGTEIRRAERMHLLRDPSLRATLPLRSRSAPPPYSPFPSPIDADIDKRAHIPRVNNMLAASAVDLTFDDDDWLAPNTSPRLFRAASVGNSWGVTSIGRGFDWKKKDEEESGVETNGDSRRHHLLPSSSPQKFRSSWVTASTITKTNGTSQPPVLAPIAPITAPKPFPNVSLSRSVSYSPPVLSRSASPAPPSPSNLASALPAPPSVPASPSSPRTSLPRPRRRSSQQRVSLIAGRVSILPVEPPSPPPTGFQTLVRANSAASYLSVASSVGPPPPNSENPHTAGERSISEFVIEKEIGRGAYGLVKRAREMNSDGTLGPPLVIKQIIKSRILADCWKRHPKYGTIPIEIYVMSAISSTSYVLPPRRPWHPTRLNPDPNDPWVEGKIEHGHPNIGPLIDFFEDNHYYYLVLPSTTPEAVPDQPPPPSDLFDLVESYPHGLPPDLIRGYLGQIADAMCFLHGKGIVHRDIKDENVVLGPAGRCVLIDFGSSGLVKKGGWDTFSGTLDYAGPEILRGERYQGKEQDVWAFGVVAYVMLVGECPFTTAAEAQEGLDSPFSSASMALDERCLECREGEGEETDGGGALADAAALVRACLQVEVGARPTFEKILQCRFLSGHGGWGAN